jgi:hypothetical protein
MGRHGPTGVPEDHVFGDEVGRPLRTTQKAWRPAAPKANGHTPQPHPHTKKPQVMSIHHVKARLGHASVSTTDIYLNATRVGLHEAMRRVDAKLDTDRKEAGKRHRHTRVESHGVLLVN